MLRSAMEEAVRVVRPWGLLTEGVCCGCMQGFYSDSGFTTPSGLNAWNVNYAVQCSSSG